MKNAHVVYGSRSPLAAFTGKNARERALKFAENYALLHDGIAYVDAAPLNPEIDNEQD